MPSSCSLSPWLSGLLPIPTTMLLKKKTARFTRALLLTFIAVLLVMALNPHPTNDLYLNNPVETPCGDAALFGMEFIQEIMTRAQLRELSCILHWTTDNYEQGVSGVEQTL